MVRISSRMTMFHKRIFPAFWFGLLGLVLIAATVSGEVWREPVFLLGPIGMGAFGYLLTKIFVADLVDEVQDSGDHLVVRNGSKEETIALRDVQNVSASVFMNPPRITLRLRRQGKFGTRIAFIPVLTWRFNTKIADELNARARRAIRSG